MSNMTPIPADALLRGSLHALAHCGQLLSDACILFQAERYATATAVALFGREEFGRHTILVDLWREADAGQAVTIDAVMERCRDHIDKQRAAQVSTTLYGTRDQGVGKLATERFEAVGKPEYESLDKLLTDVTDRKNARTPQDRHEARQRALYVDISPDGREWLLPSETSRDAASRAITEARNDYDMRRQRMENLDLLFEDVALQRTLEGLSDKPALPPASFSV